jgi:hypothetical protein
MKLGKRRDTQDILEQGRLRELRKLRKLRERREQGDTGTRGHGENYQLSITDYRLPTTNPKSKIQNLKSKILQPLAFILYLAFYPSPLAAQSRSCQAQDVKTLTADLLQDLPSYANRVSQRARRLSRSNDVYSYMLVAGRPEFAPLSLGPGVYTPTSPPAQIEPVEQIFFTTLERRYADGKPIELQEFHWLFLTKTESGWRLATMFTRTGGYPAKKPPTPPRESSDGVIAQAIETWLRDCRAETKSNDEL